MTITFIPPEHVGKFGCNQLRSFAECKRPAIVLIDNKRPSGDDFRIFISSCDQHLPDEIRFYND